MEFVKKDLNWNTKSQYMLGLTRVKNLIHVDIVKKNLVLLMLAKLMNIFTQMKNHILVKNVSDLLDNMDL